MKEFEYIKWIQGWLKTPDEVIIPSGDDCAGIKIGPNKIGLITTDVIVEGIDFHLGRGGATASQVGYKALAVSISDIAAMGGTEHLYAAATVALRPDLSGRFARQLFRGMKSIADKFKVSIIGGDVSAVNGPISISTTILGVGAVREPPIRRSGARKDDAIMVTGELGGSILGKHLTFTPRLAEARTLKRHYRIHSMIDISDGLLSDLDHILTASHKGAILFTRRIPISRAAQKISIGGATPPLQHALSDGEDFELLFIVPMSEAEKILKDKPFKTPVSLIGIIQKNPGIFLLDQNGRLIRVKPTGYEHIISS